MTWPRFLALAVMVVGGVVASVCNKDQIALILVSGAIGYAANRDGNGNGNGNGKKTDRQVDPPA
jgi:hypothetical protein